VPTVPAVVTWQAAQSEPGAISMPMGDSAIAERGVAEGAGADGSGDGSTTTAVPTMSGSATRTMKPPRTTIPSSSSATTIE